MNVQCNHCGATFDDADRLTVCPHPLIMAADDLAQKKAGIALFDRDICFAHQPAGPIHRVQSVGWNGMVTLRDMAGEFAPHLFVPAAKPPAPTMHSVVSSNIASVGHDGSDLFVAFKSGGTYRYLGIPVATFDAMRAAKSAGSYLHFNIKGKFPSVKVESQS